MQSRNKLKVSSNCIPDSNGSCCKTDEYLTGRNYAVSAGSSEQSSGVCERAVEKWRWPGGTSFSE